MPFPSADKDGVTTLDWPGISARDRRAPSRQPHASTPAATDARWPLAAWVVIVLTVLSALLGRLCYIGRPFDYDAAIFIYMGKLICDGGRLCHDLIDNKFPTVGLLTGVAWRAFGTHWWAYVVLQTAMSLSGALALAHMAGRHLGHAAALPTLLFALAYLNFCQVAFGGFQLETIEVFFAIFAAHAAMEALANDSLGDAFVVGLASGCAAMAKPTGLAVAAAFAIAIIFRHRTQWRRIAGHGLAGAAGVALPAGVTLTYLLVSGTLGDMPGLWRQLSTYAANTIWATSDLWKAAVVLSIAGFPALVRIVIYRQERIEAQQPIERTMLIFAVLWLVMEAAGVVAQRRMYAYHFLPMAAPAALLFGMIPRRPTLGSLAVPLLPVLVLSASGAASVIMYRDRGNQQSLNDYLRAHASRHDAIVWQDYTSRLMLETTFRPGSRHTLTFLFVNSDESARAFAAQILSDFRQRRPEYLVLPTDLPAFLAHQANQVAELARSTSRRESYNAAWQSIEAYAKANYVAETAIARWTVYRRAH